MTIFHSLHSVFDRYKDELGEAVHNAWMAQKQRNGFADHQFSPMDIDTNECDICELSKELHHQDMIPYHELTKEKKMLDWESGRVGFEMGYKAALTEHRL